MPYPIFVLEGPDNTGKSTLARTMCARMGAHYIHSTYRWKGKMHLYHLSQFRRALKMAQTKPVVMDRWVPSELVYGNVFRNGPEKPFDTEYRKLLQMAKDYSVSFTFCLPLRWEEYWRFFQEKYVKDQEMYPPDEAKTNGLWVGYRDLLYENHDYYSGNLYQQYNCMLSQNRSDDGFKYVGYILARWKSELHIMSQERKDLMEVMATNWRIIGKQDYHNIIIEKEEEDEQHDTSMASPFS